MAKEEWAREEDQWVQAEAEAAELVTTVSQVEAARVQAVARVQRLEADLADPHTETQTAQQGRERAEAQVLEFTTTVTAVESAREQALHDVAQLQPNLEGARS